MKNFFYKTNNKFMIINCGGGIEALKKVFFNIIIALFNS